MKTLVLALSFVFSFAAFGNESGFLYQGKTYVVYKDGEKVGLTFEEFKETQKKQSRSIAGVQRGGDLYYQEDSIARCYWMSGGEISLQCVRK